MKTLPTPATPASSESFRSQRRVVRGEAVKTATVGDLIAFLEQFDPSIELMDYRGDDLFAAHLRCNQSQAVEISPMKIPATEGGAR